MAGIKYNLIDFRSDAYYLEFIYSRHMLSAFVDLCFIIYITRNTRNTSLQNVYDSTVHSTRTTKQLTSIARQTKSMTDDKP